MTLGLKVNFDGLKIFRLKIVGPKKFEFIFLVQCNLKFYMKFNNYIYFQYEIEILEMIAIMCMHDRVSQNFIIIEKKKKKIQ